MLTKAVGEKVAGSVFPLGQAPSQCGSMEFVFCWICHILNGTWKYDLVLPSISFHLTFLRSIRMVIWIIFTLSNMKEFHVTLQ